MNLPELNPGGYVNASISHVEGFKNANFLLAHGRCVRVMFLFDDKTADDRYSGDDNVHYANSAHLIDMLTAEQVRGWRFRMFTDR
jgi:dipeptidyl aminopeptidase B